ncbi:Pycsar system effector family protein [Actinacidiphila paucisporea]|uniref:Pycsar effector protein domain-containing protein n=1 Tax=Actinacidiphila paucisporea TaxID=310782 RepID=A0A1M6YXL2_9ACTN|nr:Pycsar system effector family protein [Actinacidiphila paucisporea]SHL22843.1 hypothetical protein SAMN05216499_103157 [Actinacidiphila paucisporea]
MSPRPEADAVGRPNRLRARRSPSPPGTTALLRELIAHNHLEIGRADGKAAILIATDGSLLSLLIVRRPATSPWAQLFWWSAVFSTAAALGALLLVLIPRRDTPLHQGIRLLTYFEDVVRAQHQARLPAAIEDTSRAPESRLLRALEETSRIAHVKNRYVRRSILLLLPSLLATLVSLAPKG